METHLIVIYANSSDYNTSSSYLEKGIGYNPASDNMFSKPVGIQVGYSSIRLFVICNNYVIFHFEDVKK